eukprot:TRINITY_DN4175_c0_g1_i1.p1 TRINITY_DN4175_c0_g1~~TRINITY_DN4175_c0_g1_i1.p1  ORF type:complete len:545 (+),score=89.28 TRINITY_DN4175_c0_g1_i1:1611-3245(+)
MGTKNSVVLSREMNSTDWSRMKCPSTFILRIDRVAPDRVKYECEVCPTNFYTTGNGYYNEGKLFNPDCKQIPEGLMYNQTSEKYLVTGDFWCTNPNVTSTIECVQCPVGYCGRNSRDFDSLCVGNRKGTLCGDCKDGYTSSLIGSQCVRDDQCKKIWLFSFAVQSMLYLAFFLLRKLNEKTELKSLIYFMQIYPLLTPTNPASIVSSMLFSSATSEGEGSWRQICVHGGMDRRHVILLGLVTSLVTPAISLFIWIATSLKRKLKRRSSKVEERLLINFDELVSHVEVEPKIESQVMRITAPALWARTYLQALLFMYSTLLTASLQLLRCTKIIGEEVSVLNGNVSCHSLLRTTFLYLFLIFLFPFPIFLLALRQVLNRQRETLGKTRSALLHVLQSSYKKSVGWWESISIGRRTIYISIFVFADSNHKNLMMISISGFFLILHSCVRPFATKEGNRLEAFTLSSLLFVSALEYGNNLNQTNDTTVRYIQASIISMGALACVLQFLSGPTGQFWGLLKRKFWPGCHLTSWFFQQKRTTLSFEEQQ